MKWNLGSKLLFVLCLLFTLYFIIVHIQISPDLEIDKKQHFPRKPIVWIKSYEPGSLIQSVFESLGYLVITDGESKWDVLWSYYYPFRSLSQEMHSLNSNQKVNHLPGTSAITSKTNLALVLSEYLPKSFIFPEQKDIFLSYIKQNPKKLYVQKSSSHRHIQIFDTDHLDLKQNGTFIQEFISNPLLINNRKFDIGIYIVITSVNPLRVYWFSSDVLLRFCKKEYYPFNSSVIESYVVGSDYLPIWEVPDLKKFYTNLNYNAKESFNAYLRSQKKNPKKLWSHLIKAIQDIFIKTVNRMIEKNAEFGNSRNFFELLRFDFIVDKSLKVYLMEANMSPNLSPSHFPPNELLYKQVLFNVFSITEIVKKFPDLNFKSSNIEVSDKDLQVFPEECSSKTCNNSCKIQKCHVCFHCMTDDLKTVARSAYFEHLNRNKLRRLIPIPIPVMLRIQEPDLDPKMVTSTALDMFMDRWFKGKCLQDSTFCQ